MSKQEDFYSGASVIPDTLNNLTSQSQKSRIAVSSAYSMPIKTSMPFNAGNGIIMQTTGTTDLHLVADDLTSGADWVSRVGGFTATHVGSPTVGLETALYPTGGFAGTGYRKATADFSTTKYFSLAYNAAHAITGTSTVTCEMLIRLGVLANEEDYLSRYITALTKYNIRVYSKNDGSNNYRLYVEVDHATTNAVCNRLLTQMGLVLLTFTYDGPTKVLTMYVNGNPVVTGSGNVGSSTGVGNVSTDSLTDLSIGLTNPVIGKAMVKGQIIEIMRHQSILSAATILQRFQRMSGVQLPNGTYPALTTTHNSFGFITVNGKLWGFCRDWLMMNDKGMLFNSSFGCAMQSTAITDGTGGTSNITLTAGATVAPEAGSINSQVNGQTISLPLSGSPESAMWFHPAINAGIKSAATVTWRGISSAVAYVYIYDETTTKYWVSGTTWSLTPTAINLSSFVVSGSGTLTDPYISNVPFTTEAAYAGSHRIDVFVHNNSASDPSGIIYIYGCQACDSQQFAAEPLTVIHPSGGDGTVFLGIGIEYPASLINWSIGRITFDFRPIFSSTQPRLSPSNALTQLSGSTGNNFLQVNIGTAVFRFKDNATHVATASPTFNNYELLQFQLDWNDGNNKMTLQILNKGLSSTATYTRPLGTNNFKIGTSSQSPGGYISNLVIR